MGSAWAAEEDFNGSFNIERLDDWDCGEDSDTELEKDLLIDDTEPCF